MQPSRESEAEVYEQFKVAEEAAKIKVHNSKQNLKSLLDCTGLEAVFVAASKVLRDLTFSLKKTVDQRLKKLIKEQIISFRECQHAETFVQNIDTFFKPRIDLLKKLVSEVLKANSTMEVKLGDQSQRMVVANIVSHYGQLLQVYEKTRIDSGLRRQHRNMQLASNLYLKSLSLYPYLGKFYCLLAELTAYHHDYFGSVYWCIRANSCREPVDCQPLLDRIFDRSKQVNLSLNCQNKQTARQCLVWSFIHFFSQVSKTQKQFHIKEVIIYLRKYISFLKEQIDQQELMLLSYIIQLSLYTVFITVESMNLKRSYYQLMENSLYREAICNGFHIITTALELLNHSHHQDQKKILELSNLLLPVLVYLIEFPSTLKALSQIFINFDTLLFSIYRKFEPHKKKLRLQFKIFQRQLNLIGWKMLSQYYDRHRAMEFQKQNEAIVTWVLHTIQQLEHIDMDKMQQHYKEVKVRPAEQKTVKEKELRKDRTLIVADGRNVAIKHGKDEYFSAKGLEIMVSYWQKKGFPVLIMLPQYCFDQAEIEKRKTQSKHNEKTLPATKQDVDILCMLRKRDLAVGVPNRDYDDSYVIEYARNKKAYIVSSDAFRDAYTDQRLTGKKKEELRAYLRQNCMTFTFVKDDFLPNPDFLKSKNIQ